MPHALDPAIMEFSGFSFELSWTFPVILSSSIVPTSAVGIIYLAPVFVPVEESQGAWKWALVQWDGSVYNMVPLLHHWSIMTDFEARSDGFL
jgi:hypothetical protein